MKNDTAWDDKACDIAREIDKWETLKMDVDQILKELRTHSPLWSKLLRRYIRSLEREAAGK
jgi:hypothetical protein